MQVFRQRQEQRAGGVRCAVAFDDFHKGHEMRRIGKVHPGKTGRVREGIQIVRVMETCESDLCISRCEDITADQGLLIAPNPCKAPFQPCLGAVVPDHLIARFCEKLRDT